MVKQQPEALRLADALEDDLTGYDGLSIPGFCQNIANEAAAELRRLHQSETEGWRYADELEQEHKRLNLQNKELLEALKVIEQWNSHTVEMSIDYGSIGVRDFYRDIARAAIAKVTGE